MIDAGVNTFVEIGPRAVLTLYLSRDRKGLGAAAFVLPSLTRKEAGGARLSELIIELELSGGLRDRRACFPRPVDVWICRAIRGSASGTGIRARANRKDSSRARFFIRCSAMRSRAIRCIGRITSTSPSCRSMPIMWSAAAAVLPASGFVEMALAAGRERRRLEKRAPSAPQVIEDLEIVAPLLLESEHSRTVRLRLDAASGRFTIVSRERLREDPWRTLATGRLVEDCLATGVPPLATAERDADVTAETHYAFARTLGIAYGPAFRSVDSVWYRREGILGAIVTPPEISSETATTLLHPAYLDGAFQLLADLALRDRARHVRTSRPDLPAFLPVRIDRLELLQPHAQVTLALAAPADSEPHSRRSLRANFTLFDAFEAPIATARGVRFQAVIIHAGTAHRASWLSDARRADAAPTP